MSVESGYKFQAKATTEFGIEFRSKLEAQWAYYFQSRGLDWQYADHAWYDFVVNGIKIEVKPYAEGMLHRAAERVPFREIVVVVFGSPPLGTKEGVAISVFKKYRNGVCFRDAIAGTFQDAKFFSLGLNMDIVHGHLHMYDDGNDNGMKYGTDLVGLNPSVCRSISGLLGKLDKDMIKHYMKALFERCCNGLN